MNKESSTQFICPSCRLGLIEKSGLLICDRCGKKIPKSDDVPVFTEDKYWGKVPEDELKQVIETIDKRGFESFDDQLQKKFDYTSHEDRADWRFFIPITKESKILDIGAGLGRISIPLSRICSEVVACDKSITRMRFLKRRAQNEKLDNIKVVVADIFDLPFKDNSFDLIVMNGVLEWVGQTDLFVNPRYAQIRSLEICRRLLKEGGHLYIGIENRFAHAYLKASDHNGLRFTSYMPRWLANVYSIFRGRGPYNTYTYSKSGYTKLLLDSGFTSSQDYYLVYPGYNLPRILVPYDSINAIRYLINKHIKKNNRLSHLLLWFFSINLFIRLYRLFFYSFSIIAKR
jgi:ubiquinone/menaquinone biosynthesis C-methylase UbiE